MSCLARARQPVGWEETRMSRTHIALALVLAALQGGAAEAAAIRRVQRIIAGPSPADPAGRGPVLVATFQEGQTL